MTRQLKQKDDLGQVDLVHIPDPFAVRNYKSKVPAGFTIAEMVHEIIPSPKLKAHVYINGHYIPFENWSKIRPKQGSHLLIRAVPTNGGGGKSPMATVLSLAIMVAAPYAAPYIGAAIGSATGISAFGFAAGSSFAVSSFGMMFGRAVFSLAGMLLISALCPPSRPRDNAISTTINKPTQYITGSQNQANKFGAIPRVLGTHRMVPSLAAASYTETVGKDQYYRMLFCWGYGPISLSDIKIGETPLTDFTDYTIEHRYGFLTDTPLTIYSNTVIQQPLNITLNAAVGSGATFNITASGSGPYAVSGAAVNAGGSGYRVGDLITVGTGTVQAVLTVKTLSGSAVASVTITNGGTYGSSPAGTGVASSPYFSSTGYQIQTTETNVDEISIDITYPKGLAKFNSAGALLDVKSDVYVQYAVAGSGSWVDVATQPAISNTLHTSDSQTFTLTWSVSKGQYDVRIKRDTPNTASNTTFDQVVWSALRSIRSSYPINMAGLALTAIRIKATDQLNGTLSQFNGVVTALINDWNGSTWVANQPSNNPASIMREVMQGPANARPLADSRLDLPGLQQWHEDCKAAGYSFNYVVDATTDCGTLLDDIAAAGRASKCQVDGVWSVVQDKPKTDIAQHFTPRNTYGFKGTKMFPVIPHGLKMNFIDETNGYLQNQITVYDDGYNASNATKFETIDVVGITNPTHVWKMGRYHIAVGKLRPEAYQFDADVEHLCCTRGDLVVINHDVMLVGLGYARIKAVNVDGGGNAISIDIDDVFEMDVGINYAVRIRADDGTSVYKTIITNPGDQTNVVFTTPFPATAIDVDNLVLFGEAGLESAQYLVKSVMPKNNITAEITCVDYSPAIFTADTSTIPPFNNSITLPDIMKRPPQPIMLAIQTGDDALIRNTDGTYSNSAIITLKAPNYQPALDVKVEIQGSTETAYHSATCSVSGNKVTVTSGLVAGNFYNFSITYKNSNGMCSAPLIIPNVQITGGTTAPSDVTNFNLNVLGGTAHMSWTPVPDVNLAYYVIKYNSATSGATWANSFMLIPKVSPLQSAVTVPALPGTYLIKAINTIGKESVNEDDAVSTVASTVNGYTTVTTVTESPAFTGSKTNCSVAAATLTLTNDTVGGDGDTILGSGTYSFANYTDMGAVYTAKLVASITAAGVDNSSGVDDWGNVDTIVDWDGAQPPSTWGLQLQIRTTQTDPASSPTWSDWAPFVTGEYSCRAFEFQLVLYSYATNITPAVTALSVLITVPNRSESANAVTGLSTDAGGTAFTYVKPFKATPSLGITAQSMATGDYFTLVSESATGFTIKFFNSSNARITRTFNYTSSGYGQGV